MVRPAPVEFDAEGRVHRQRPITGLVIKAVPEGDRQGQRSLGGSCSRSDMGAIATTPSEGLTVGTVKGEQRDWRNGCHGA